MTLQEMSILGAILTAMIVLLRKAAGRRLLPECYLALWALAVCRFLLPITIALPYNVYPLFEKNHDTAMEIQYIALPIEVTEAVNRVTGEAAGTLDWLFILWAAGALLCFFYMTGSHWQCRRWYAASLPMEDAFTAQWKQEHPLRRAYQIRRAEWIQTPLTYGLFRPVILLPSAHQYEREELHLVLLHEWNHIRHLDVLWHWLLVILCSLHWFNPMAWILYILCRQDLELFCDEATVKQMKPGENRRYAMFLLQQASRIKAPVPLFSSSRFTGYQRLEERIETIMKPKPFNWKVFVITVLLLCIGGTAFATAAQDDGNYADTQQREAAAESLQWPVDADKGVWISNLFGERPHPITGEVFLYDLIVISGQDREGEAVLAAADGTVQSDGFDSREGYSLAIQHNNGMMTRYGHCAELLVKQGDQVKAGQKIASIGKTGEVTGPCLSFAVYENGEAVDPMLLLTVPAEHTEREYENGEAVDPMLLPTVPAERTEHEHENGAAGF